MPECCSVAASPLPAIPYTTYHKRMPSNSRPSSGKYLWATVPFHLLKPPPLGMMSQACFLGVAPSAPIGQCRGQPPLAAPPLWALRRARLLPLPPAPSISINVRAFYVPVAKFSASPPSSLLALYSPFGPVP